MIPAELRAEVRRLFFAEHLAVNTISEMLGVHHDTVRTAIGSHTLVSTPAMRKSQLDPYMPFIRETLEKYPKLRSTRLFLMLKDRGCQGSVQQLRRIVRRVRPLPLPVFLALTTMPGEQAQCDCGSFGTLRVGKAVRKLSCFVMVLRYPATASPRHRCRALGSRLVLGLPQALQRCNAAGWSLSDLG